MKSHAVCAIKMKNSGLSSYTQTRTGTSTFYNLLTWLNVLFLTYFYTVCQEPMLLLLSNHDIHLLFFEKTSLIVFH